MAKASDISINRRRQARSAVQIALMIAFCAAMLGVSFGVALGAVSPAEGWLISLCAIVSGAMLLLISMRPTMEVDAIVAALGIFFMVYLNVVAIFAYAASEEILAIIPYITWFYPLVVFHHFTDYGFYKRQIGMLVNASPLPISAFVLGHPTASHTVDDVGATIGYLFSFIAFVIFISYLTRHRDQEILRVARAEEAERSANLLRVSEERFRLLSRATNDLIWDADLKSGRIWWNNTLLDKFGYDPAAFASDMSAWESWIHPVDRDRVVKSLQRAIDSHLSNWASEYRLVCADGRIVDVVDRGLIICDEYNEPIRVIGNTTDVTELRALEKKLRHSQKLEAIGKLTGGIAHDFNNLLTVIVGSAENLADICAHEPKARRLAEVTLQAAERGATLTSHLLSFARRQALAPKLLNPKTVLSGIKELIHRTINEDIEIEVRSDNGIWPIEADPGQLDNAILNLVINARDAMPDGGHLTVVASNVMLTADELVGGEALKDGSYVMISVTDNGCGMPMDVVERAFEPFFTTKEVGKGSGLGLSMVWGFVQQSNGFARIYSELGHGTSIKLYFPAANSIEEQLPASINTAGLIGGTEHILVVEDDDMVRSHVVAQLESLGYTVMEARCAADAIEILDNVSAIDLLFTDVIMPGGMNGRELAESALVRLPNLKVLFTSGYTEHGIVHQGRLDPNVNFLNKPYRRADLAVKIRSALDG